MKEIPLNTSYSEAFINKRDPYSPPEIVYFSLSSFETGITTHLAEATSGVWNAGS